MSTLPVLKPQRTWIPILLILLLATGLSFYKIGAESLWNEELYSIHDTLLVRLVPLDLLIRITHIRPVYFILLRIWMLFGDSDAWLRSFSALCSIGNVFLTYRLGQKIAGKPVGWIASLMLALSPMSIYFAQMVRMYALGMLLGLLGSLALAHALEAPKTKFLGGWAVSRLLVFLTAPLNLTLLLPDLILFGATYRKQPKHLISFGKWLTVVMIACLPSAFSLVSGTLPFLRDAFDVSSKVTVSDQVASPPSFGEVVRKFKKFTAFPFPSTSSIMSRLLQAYTIVLIALAGLGFYKNRSANRLLWVAAWTFIPWIVHAAVSKTMLFDRYILYTMPYLLILLATGLVRVWQMHRLPAALIAVVYAIAITAGISRYYTVQDRQDWRGLATVISQHEQPGDLILLSIDSEKMPRALTHYYKGDTPIERIMGICTSPDIEKTEASLALSQIPPVKANVWLVCSSGFDEHVFPTILGDRLNLEAHWQFVNEVFYRQEDYMNLFKVTLKQP
ncbi:MAG: glycosyltransferase family 39 protein [Cyanobacteria bacterium P01_A01_bin.114]